VPPDTGDLDLMHGKDHAGGGAPAREFERGIGDFVYAGAGATVLLRHGPAQRAGFL